MIVASSMSKKQRKEVGEYIRDLADLLMLRDWAFTLKHDPITNDDEAIATVTATYGRKRAVIELCADFLEMSHEEIRHVLVHELIHVHMEPSCSIVRHSLPAMVGQPAYLSLWESFTQQIEYGVDGLADGIAPLLPLPKFKKGVKR